MSIIAEWIEYHGKYTYRLYTCYLLALKNNKVYLLLDLHQIDRNFAQFLNDLLLTDVSVDGESLPRAEAMGTSATRWPSCDVSLRKIHALHFHCAWPNGRQMVSLLASFCQPILRCIIFSPGWAKHENLSSIEYYSWHVLVYRVANHMIYNARKRDVCNTHSQRATKLSSST